MRLRRIARLGWATGALCVVGSGCAPADDVGDEPDEPLTIQRPPVTPGGPIGLDRPFDETGFFQFDSWPQGCDLVTDDELRAVLPQVEAVEREPRDYEVNLLGTGRTPTARGATCVLRVDIPAAGLPAQSDRPFPPTINVSVSNAGSPSVVDRNFDPVDDTPIEVRGGECYPDVVRTGIMCRADAVSFNVSVIFPLQQQGADGWRDHYRVDGEPTTFSSEDGAGTEHERDQFVRGTIAARLAEVVLAKLPPRTATPPPAG